LSTDSRSILDACYRETVARTITTVAQVRSFLERYTWEIGHEEIYRRCFELVRQMHWGLFRDLEREDHPELWRLIVTADRWHPDVGDLKRKINTSSLYCGFVDIHSYTAFCERNKLNYSMIEMLDSMIQREIREIARRNGCVSRRTGGDMIILVGAAAGAMINTVLGIIDYFSVRRTIRSNELSETRTGYQVAMPDLSVSAGIAGGLGYSSVIITQDGDLSGSIVNTAARLQSFAGLLAPDRSSLVVTGQVHSALRNGSEAHFSFFDYGRIHFKGNDVPVYEILYSEADFRKLEYQQEFTTLLDTIRKGLWRERLLPDVLNLADRVLETRHNDRSRFLDVIRELRDIRDLWASQDRLELLGEGLQHLADSIRAVNDFDPVVQRYLDQTADLFVRAGEEYRRRLTQAVRDRQDSIFTGKERRIMRLAERISTLRDRLLERGRRTLPESTRRKEWNATLDFHTKNLRFEIYSGKR